MIKKTYWKYFSIVAICLFSSCLEGPRQIDPVREWNIWSAELKMLIETIQTESADYSLGNNDLPQQFEYPLDQGFSIEHYGRGKQEAVDPARLTIYIYTERGIMDHFSAFVFTNDSNKQIVFDNKVLGNETSIKIEDNWYFIIE